MTTQQQHQDTKDPFLSGYGGAYEGYGGGAPNFNRHFTSITSPPDEKQQHKLPLPNLGRGWFKGAGAFKDINYNLLISKIFYFFFYAAFGSLFPLIAVYFKQIGMNPSQSGVLIGFRPFVEFISAPFFGSLADKYKVWKQILLFSIICWIAFTLGLAFVKPPPHACLTANASHIIMVPPWSKEAMNIDPANEPNKRKKRSLENLDEYDLDWNVNVHRYSGVKKSNLALQKETGQDKINDQMLQPNQERENIKEELPQGMSDDDKESDDFQLTFYNQNHHYGLGSSHNNMFPYFDERHLPIEAYMSSRSRRGASDEDDLPNSELYASGEVDTEHFKKNLADNSIKHKILNFHELLPHPKIVIYGKSPLPLDHTKIANVDEKSVEGLVSPPFSSVVFKASDVQSMFWLILFLMMLGEY